MQYSDRLSGLRLRALARLLAAREQGREPHGVGHANALAGDALEDLAVDRHARRLGERLDADDGGPAPVPEGEYAMLAARHGPQAVERAVEPQPRVPAVADADELPLPIALGRAHDEVAADLVGEGADAVAHMLGS